MKNWIVDNSKWLYPTITFIGGLLLGFYLTVLRYESTMVTIKEKVTDIKDDLKDLQRIIQNKVLTTGE
jgi:hypothetical protein